MTEYRVVEICAGAGGQALGLELAGFEHELAVELDETACATLCHNRPQWKVARGDVASSAVWNPGDYLNIDLLAGGVPCPPFTTAGKQLGATDERDLFAWAVELCGTVAPRALLLENVRGLSLPRFSAYRQHVVLVAMRPEDFAYFTWPEPAAGPPHTVGETLRELMEANGWRGAKAWAARANDIAPTIVGGSKKHGGADLGPTRAKRAWREMGVDALGCRVSTYLANGRPLNWSSSSVLIDLASDPSHQSGQFLSEAMSPAELRQHSAPGPGPRALPCRGPRAGMPGVQDGPSRYGLAAARALRFRCGASEGTLSGELTLSRSVEDCLDNLELPRQPGL